MGRGSAVNGLKFNVWKDGGWSCRGKACFACTSGAMSIDNGLHLMSGGRRGFRDKKDRMGGKLDRSKGMTLFSYLCLKKKNQTIFRIRFITFILKII